MARPTRIILAAIAFLAAAALSSTCEARGKGGSSGSHASSAGGRSHSHSHSTGSRRSGGSAHARRTAAEAAIGRDRRDVAAEREFVRRDKAKLERDRKAGN